MSSRRIVTQQDLKSCLILIAVLVLPFYPLVVGNRPRQGRGLCLLSFKTIYFEVENLEADSKGTKWLLNGEKMISYTTDAGEGRKEIIQNKMIDATLKSLFHFISFQVILLSCLNIYLDMYNVFMDMLLLRF